MKDTAQEDSLLYLEQQAVKAAVKGAWDQAIEFNQKILELKQNNIAALNRLGRAFWEKGDLAKARKIFNQALEIDPFNHIASKNLKRLSDQRKPTGKGKPVVKSVEGSIFLEEPGKTKIVRLARLASAEILSELDSGDEVFLDPKSRTVNVIDKEDIYLGCIPDDLSFRLLTFIRGGNLYKAFVKAVDRQNLEIIIRETKRVTRFRHSPSFTLQGKPSEDIDKNEFPMA